MEPATDAAAAEAPPGVLTGATVAATTEPGANAAQSYRPSAVVRDGDTVIAVVNDDRQTLVSCRGNAKFKVGKERVSCAELLGRAYGTRLRLEIERGQPARLLPELGGLDPAAGLKSGANNSGITDHGADAAGHAQTLDKDQIEELKASGVKGEALIAAVVAGSKTFEQRTEFSQQKYLKKKRKKYIQIVHIKRATALSLSECHFSKDPQKIGHLRYDALALMMRKADVHAGCKPLIVDTCQGLLTAAVVERVGGHCDIFHGHGTQHPSIDCVRKLDVSPSVRHTVVTFPLTQVGAITECTAEQAAAAVEQGEREAAERQAMIAARQAEEAAAKAAEAVAAQAAAGSAAAEAAEPAKVFRKRDRAPDRRWGLTPGQIKAKMGDGCGTLLIASRFAPAPLLLNLLPLLKPSSPFAVFSPSLQPLAECMEWLQGDRCACQLELCDVYTRPHQVDTNRTHPMMQVYLSSPGYILSGYTTDQKPEPWKAPEHARPKEEAAAAAPAAAAAAAAEVSMQAEAAAEPAAEATGADGGAAAQKKAKPDA